MPDHLEAGRNALQRGAWPDAKRAFELALTTASSPEAFEGLGWAEYWLGATEASLDDRERAYRAYVDANDRAAAARIAIGLAVGSFDVRGSAVASGWLECARRQLRGVPVSPVHGLLALYEGHIARLVDDDSSRARKLARKAARIAEECGEEELGLLAGALEGLALVNEGKIDEGMRRVDEATAAAMAGEMRDLDSVAQTCCTLLYACERVRDYKRAAEWQRRIDAFCRRWNIQPLFDACSTQHAAMLAGCGDWRGAEEALRSTIERIETSRPYLLPDAIVHLAELRRRQGAYDEALALARRVETRTESMLTRAAIALDRDDPADALDLADRVLQRPLGEKWVERALALHLLVRATDDRKRAEEAAARVSAIASRVKTPMIAAIASMAAGDVAADFDDARASYAAAFDCFTDARAPFEAAIARVALGSALQRGGRQSAAVQEIDAAIATFQTLGAKRELEKARAAREVALVVTSAPSGEPLSRREKEVLHLIAGGMGDKQLARKLSLSEHTVHRHVSNILRKLGVGSRSAAVALAMRSGWL